MKVTIRADSVEIEGYVNAVGRDSRKMTDEYGYQFVEQMQPGVFGRAINAAEEKGEEILMLLDHDRRIGGTNTNLELEEDSIGLHARAEVTDPDTIQAAKDKRLKGWSFGFRQLDSKEGHGEDCMRRTVTELDLVEVSVIDDRMTPAYAGTSIHARANEETEKVYTRAIDDQVEYQEEPEEKSEDKPEEKPEDKPEDETEDKPEEEPEERSYIPNYKNKVTLLKLGR